MVWFAWKIILENLPVPDIVADLDQINLTFAHAPTCIERAELLKILDSLLKPPQTTPSLDIERWHEIRSLVDTLHTDLRSTLSTEEVVTFDAEKLKELGTQLQLIYDLTISPLKDGEPLNIFYTYEWLSHTAYLAQALSLPGAEELGAVKSVYKDIKTYATNLLYSSITGSRHTIKHNTFRIDTPSQYEKHREELITLGALHPDAIIEQSYLRHLQTLIKQGRSEIGEVPTPINILDLHVDKFSAAQRIRYYLNSAANFLEARYMATASLKPDELGTQIIPDLDAALELRREQLAITTKFQIYGVYPSSYNLADCKNLPCEAKRLLIENATLYGEYVLNPDSWKSFMGHVNSHKKEDYAAAVDRIASIVHYAREHPEPELRSEIDRLERIYSIARYGIDPIEARKRIEGISAVMSPLTVQFGDSTYQPRFEHIGDESLNMLVKPEQARVLRDHIREGLKLIKSEKYSEAKAHFENEAVLEECTFNLGRGNIFILTSLQPQYVMMTLQSIASRSWFMIDQRTVQPSFGAVPRNFNYETASVEDRAVFQDFEREICLIYAEEWTHALQHATGGPVSRKGLFLKGGDLFEHDVAEYFRENGVKMSKLFLSRYQREDAVTKLRGFQTPEFQREFSERLTKLEPGQKLQIGRTAELTLPSFREDYTVSLCHAEIERLEDGNLRLRDLSNHTNPLNHTFFQDEQGVWQTVVREQILPPSNARFRIGPYFELLI